MLRQKFKNIDIRDYRERHPALFDFVKEQMARPGKEFLLIGDTDHSSRRLRRFLTSPALTALFSHAAIPHVCVELPRESIPPEKLDEFRQNAGQSQQGKLSAWRQEKRLFLRFAGMIHHHQWNSISLSAKAICAIATAVSLFITPPILSTAIFLIALATMAVEYKKAGAFFSHAIIGLTKAGLRVTAADSVQWQNYITNLDQRFRFGDREVADYIKKQRKTGADGSNRTAVVYGMAHFRHTDGMSMNLGQKNTVRIDIYKNRAAYRRYLEELWRPGEIEPDRIYFLKERTLEPSLPAQARAAFNAAALPLAYEVASAGIKKLPHIDTEYFNHRPPAVGEARAYHAA